MRRAGRVSLLATNTPTHTHTHTHTHFTLQLSNRRNWGGVEWDAYLRDQHARGYLRRTLYQWMRDHPRKASRVIARTLRNLYARENTHVMGVESLKGKLSRMKNELYVVHSVCLQYTDQFLTRDRVKEFMRLPSMERIRAQVNPKTEQEMAALKAQLVQKDGEIADLKVEIRTKDEVHTVVVREKDAEIARLHQALKEKRANQVGPLVVAPDFLTLPINFLLPFFSLQWYPRLARETRTLPKATADRNFFPIRVTICGSFLHIILFQEQSGFGSSSRPFAYSFWLARHEVFSPYATILIASSLQCQRNRIPNGVSA